MDFRKSSKRSHFRKIILWIFSGIHDRITVYNDKNLQHKFLDWKSVCMVVFHISQISTDWTPRLTVYSQFKYKRGPRKIDKSHIIRKSKISSLGLPVGCLASRKLSVTCWNNLTPNFNRIMLCKGRGFVIFFGKKHVLFKCKVC